MSSMVPVRRVAKLANPLLNWPWCCPAPSTAEFAALLETATPVPEPISSDGSAELHIGRIRHLAQHGWADAIELDVGVPVLGYPGPAWPVLDGNHRLAAALVRGDEEIKVDVAGQLDYAAKLLGVPESRLQGRQHVQRKARP